MYDKFDLMFDRTVMTKYVNLATTKKSIESELETVANLSHEF